MKMFPMLILVIGAALTASCATPTTPEFPVIECKEIRLTDAELKELQYCTKDKEYCPIKFVLLKKIFSIVQEKSSCLEQYKAGASKFKG